MELYVLPVSEAAALTEEYCAAHFPKRLERSKSYHFEADRLRCIGAGALISHVTGIAEADLIAGEHGKIDAPRGMRFNVSHSGDYVLLARCDTEVGADIERVAEPRMKLAPRVFLPDEIEWLEQDPAERFYLLWTLKESVLKLTGMGFSMSPLSFSVLPMPAGKEICLNGRTIYGANLRIGDCAAAVCACEPFAAPVPVYLTARELLKA